VQLIHRRFLSLAGHSNSFHVSTQVSGMKIVVTVDPVPDPQQFAQRINFGTVTSIEGRVIKMTVTRQWLEAEARRQRQVQLAQAAGGPPGAGGTQQPGGSGQLGQRTGSGGAERPFSGQAGGLGQPAAGLGPRFGSGRHDRRDIIDFGPGWELRRVGIDQVLVHYEAGYRIKVPPFWEIDPTALRIPKLSPSEGRTSAVGIARSGFGWQLEGALVIETYKVGADEKPADILSEWEKALRRKRAYRRTGKIEEYTVGQLPAARINYSYRDRENDALLEVNALRRGTTLYVVTAGVGRREGWMEARSLREMLRSFELIEPQGGAEPEGAAQKRQREAQKQAAKER